MKKRRRLIILNLVLSALATLVVAIAAIQHARQAQDVYVVVENEAFVRFAAETAAAPQLEEVARAADQGPAPAGG